VLDSLQVSSVEKAAAYISPSRLDGIDLLRGLAILLVLMNHVSIRLLGAKVAYLAYIPAQLGYFLVWNGQLGVQIFFAVSGFLITSITLRRWGTLAQVNLRDFYALRFARIAPLLLLLLAVLSCLDLAGVHNFVVTAKTGGLCRALLAAFTLHINVLEARRGYLPGNWDILWSLSIEEMFYLFFPLVCRLFGRGKLLVAILVGFVALGPFGRTIFARGSEIWSEYCYLGGMEGIALGCLTALVSARLQFSRSSVRALAVSGATIVVTSLIFSWQENSSFLGRFGLNMTILGIGTCMVIAATAQSKWKSPRFLVPLTAPMLSLGRYSYEVYLTHMFVVLGFFALFLRAGKPMGGVPVFFVATIIVAGAVGAAASYLYSEPINRFLRRKLLTEPRTGASAALPDRSTDESLSSPALPSS
jgi:peptidoglycan/LPS O-acetylase OafA/YrhL